MPSPAEQWTQLASAGLLGSDRLGGVASSDDQPWSLTASDSTNAPAEYLAHAAALAIYELAGRAPAPADDPGIAPQKDHDRPCSPAAGQHLARILFGDDSAVLIEWCAAAVEAGVVAPAEFAPTILDQARRSPDSEIQQRLLAVAGRRGAWLAGLNKNWRSAASSAAEPGVLIALWETGEKGDRLAALRQLREIQPGRCRELIASTWEADPAAERAEFVATLEIGLSGDDEPWLEQRLDDRSLQVRAAAARLLSRIDGSALGRRMAEHVGQMVTFVPATGKLRKKRATIEFVSPHEASAAMKRDSLEMKAHGGLGPKAGLLLRLTGLTPLGAWEAVESDPGVWIAAATGSDWADALVRGWIAAATTQQNARWAAALLHEFCLRPATAEQAAAADWRLREIAPLMETLPSEEAERVGMAALAQGKKLPTSLADAVVTACDFPWSAEFSRAVLAAMASRLADANVGSDYALLQTLTFASTRLDTGQADAVAKAWSDDRQQWSATFSQGVYAAIDTVRFRRDMLAALR